MQTISIHSWTVNQQNQLRLSKLIDDLFQQYSKLTIIRVDLGIKKEHASAIDETWMKAKWTQMRNNMRNNQLFTHCITYALGLEYGLEKGWHFHAYFFFNGQYINHDCHYSQQIIQYWSNTITQNMGLGYSGNLNQSNYIHNAIGCIAYHETDKIKHLKQCITYICKERDHNIAYPTDLAGKSSRSLFIGQIPTASNAGRPRNK